MTNGIARIPVLPRKVAAGVTVFAATRGAWSIAATTLLVSVPGMISLYSRQGYLADLTQPIAALVLMVGLIGVLIVSPSIWTQLAYLVVGGFCVYLFLHGVLDSHANLLPGALILINRPATALVLVGTVSARPLVAIAWGVGGFLLGEAATLIVSVQDGISINYGYGPILTLAFYCAVFVGLAFIQRAQRGRVPDFLRLRIESRKLEAVRTSDQRAVALLHDTVLNDLALVINGPDVVSEKMRDAMLRDVTTLAASDVPEGVDRSDFIDPSDADLRNQMTMLVTDLQWRGLNVDVTGDTGRVVHISQEVQEAAVGAVRACLENVLRHSGRHMAEIAIATSGQWITWTISDDGIGFDTDNVAADRLGLRTSVRQRVESVGGSVKVFSSVGNGTSVIVTLPMLSLPSGRPR